MRKEPELAVPDIRTRVDSDTIRHVRKYELITPLFGGGVEPGKADPITTIRPASIRGQLRFWWRASRGGEFGGSLNAMKDAEDQLWGAASTEEKFRVSQVQISIDITKDGEPFVAHDHSGREVAVHAMNSQYGYVAFPLKGDNQVLSKIVFGLTIRFPRAHQANVEAALWAWETFGGIGGRTRRGFGALALRAIDNTAIAPMPANTTEIEQTIRRQLAEHVSSGTWPGDVPHLTPNLVFKVTSLRPNPMDGWERLVGYLKKFRQDRPTNPLGRSRWPEPDAIRRLSTSSSRHAIPVSLVDKFPRAAFGLPIIFRFKDDRTGPPLDPPQTLLRGKEKERLASPLILRPLACGNGQAVGLAAILESPRIPPGGLVLNGIPGKPKVRVTSDLDASEAASNALKRLSPVETDVLAAFLRTIV